MPHLGGLLYLYRSYMCAVQLGNGDDAFIKHSHPAHIVT